MDFHCRVLVVGLVGLVLSVGCRSSGPPPASPVTTSTPARCSEGAAPCVARAKDLAAHDQPAEAVAILQQVCHTDDEPLGCSALARYYLDERNGEPDPKASEEAGRRGILGWIPRCEAKDLEACLHLGADFVDLAHDPASAFAVYDLACGYDHADACAEAGTFAQDGAGVPRDRDLAIQRYLRGCQLKSATGCYYLGLVLQDGKGAAVAIDEQDAVRALSTACELRDLRACNNLGIALATGRGVAQDLAAAVEVYLAACAAGHAKSCNNAGANIENGNGAAIDLARARALYERGCDGGSPDACLRLGVFFDWGMGVAPDLTVARPHFERACELDSGAGCTAFGNVLHRGLGGPKDDILAFRAYQKGCELGHLEGCDELAVAYAFGHGVAEDDAKAVATYLAACERGRMQSCGSAGMRIFLNDDHVAAIDPFTKHCYSDAEEFRGSCAMVMGISAGTYGDTKDSARELSAAERVCVVPLRPDEMTDVPALIPVCERAIAMIDALPPSAAQKARRQLLVAALAALRAKIATP